MKHYTNSELEEYALNIENECEILSMGLNALTDNNPSDQAVELFQKMGSNPVQEANKFYNNCKFYLDKIKNKTNSYDAKLIEISSGVAVYTTSIFNYYIQYTNMLIKAPDFNTGKNSPEFLEVKKNISGAILLLTKINN